MLIISLPAWKGVGECTWPFSPICLGFHALGLPFCMLAFELQLPIHYYFEITSCISFACFENVYHMIDVVVHCRQVCRVRTSFWYRFGIILYVPNVFKPTNSFFCWLFLWWSGLFQKISSSFLWRKHWYCSLGLLLTCHTCHSTKKFQPSNILVDVCLEETFPWIVMRLFV